MWVPVLSFYPGWLCPISATLSDSGSFQFLFLLGLCVISCVIFKAGVSVLYSPLALWKGILTDFKVMYVWGITSQFWIPDLSSSLWVSDPLTPLEDSLQLDHLLFCLLPTELWGMIIPCIYPSYWSCCEFCCIFLVTEDLLVFRSF